MCGIVGYIGNRQAAPVLLDSLAKLEYRGYDSAGVAVMHDNEIEIVKAKGRLSVLNEKLDGGKKLNGFCGIGHTRWATHGEPNETNAHPHSNDDKTIVAVHNGIIENFAFQKEKLKRRGYKFYSETDTEVATKLVDYYYKKYNNPVRAIANFALRVRGSYALAVMYADRPGEIYAVRKDSPMIFGVTEGESFLASDVPAILKYTNKVYYIDDMEIACMTKGGVKFCNLDGDPLEKKITEIDWDIKAAEKDGYEHFMMKEMHEQPRVVKDTLNYFVRDGEIDLSEIGLTDKEVNDTHNIIITACGSAYHVGVVMQYLIEKLARVPVRVELASEFRYRNPILHPKDLVIVISQSGETADSLAALRLAKEHNIKTLAIVNVVGSPLSKQADKVLYTKAGPEISVATTKAYSAQLIAGYLIALKFAKTKSCISDNEYKRLLGELFTLPEKIQSILDDREYIQRFAFANKNKDKVFFIGRGIDYAICLEGSLKLKEISYIHSEAYASGELKHGTISLIEKGTLVLGVLTQGALREKEISNLIEVKSRGAQVVTVGEDTVPSLSRTAFKIPPTSEYFAASLAIIPLQLFAYYISVLRGNDVDNPRNLAKSVTVE